MFKAMCASAMLVVAATPSHAQTPAVEATLEARKVVREADGREHFSSAETVKPGDVIEYVATYRNTTSQLVRELEATLPIPPGTEWLAGTARPSGARASLDAREFAAPPLKRKVVRDGREVDEPVPFREYRYLRWPPVHLGAQMSVSFSARVRVLE
ncbi:MAG: hypothetical protein ACXWF0_13370 [Usitatibacter sp.]